MGLDDLHAPYITRIAAWIAQKRDLILKGDSIPSSHEES